MTLRPDRKLLAHLILVFGVMVALPLLLGMGLWQWHQQDLAVPHYNALHTTRH